ncbi:MAG: ankyrin repeat domain-containing protein [Treponema sp.]|nr:ankyrin repeat domain-containing protein [Treponema sp.]
MAKISASDNSSTYDTLIQSGSAEDITKALKKNSDLITYTIGKNNDTLLMSAISQNRSKDIIKLLLDAGISPAKKNKIGQSAVSYVCQYCKNSDTASLVLSYGTFSKSQIRTRLMTKDKNGKYAAQYIEQNNSSEVQQLVKSYLSEKDNSLLFGNSTGNSSPLDNQQDIPSAEPSSAAAVTEAAPSGVPPAAGSVGAIQDGAVGIKTEEQQPALQQNTQPSDAVKNQNTVVQLPPSDTEVVKPSKISAYKQTSLYEYADDDSADTDTRESAPQNELISGANSSDANGVTPLMSALKEGNDWEVNSLLYSGADVNAVDSEGWTPLMYAVRYQNNETLVHTLISHGANVRMKNNYKASALTMASQYSENPEILSDLLAAYYPAEEDVFKSFIYAITATTSSDRVYLAKAQLFLNKGIPLNRFWEGKTPLMYAAESGNSTALISLLLKNGAIISTRTADKKTAFDFARTNTRLPHDQIYWSLNTGR